MIIGTWSPGAAMYRDIGSWSLGPARIRLLLDAAAFTLALALFTQVGDPDYVLDGLWITVAVGGFVFGLRRVVVRIAAVLAVMAGYSVAADYGAVRPLAFELLELTEWPVILVIAMIVSVMADRVSATARRYAGLYRSASDRLVNAQEHERERLARDLHDGVGQNLTALILSLDAAASTESRGDMREALQRARGLAARALDEAHDVAAQLRPARIKEIGLGAAISDLAGSAGLPIEIRFDPATLPPGLLDPQREIHAFRIVLEALSNAARHSRAEHVAVDAEARDGFVRLTVNDDGVGLGPSPREGGLGLSGMDERARLLRGELRVESTAGRGTTVELTVPLVGAVPSDSMGLGGGVMEPAG
jgi:signal transduction histidine kinase